MSDKKIKAGWHCLYDLFTNASDEHQFEQLMDLFLTPEEYNDMAMRAHIVNELLKGQLSQRKISSELGVSIAKITRGSNGLKRTSKHLISYLQKHLSKETMHHE